MVYLVLFGIFLALVIAIMVTATDRGRYTEMSEEEFRAEADRVTLRGAAMLGLHKIFQPKRVEYMLKRDKRVEAERTESGDHPPEEAGKAPHQNPQS